MELAQAAGYIVCIEWRRLTIRSSGPPPASRAMLALYFQLRAASCLWFLSFNVGKLKMQAIYFEGLVFREFEDGDATSFASAARESVETVGRWMPWCSATFSDQDALDWFQACRTSLALGSAFEFGVFSESTAEFIGGVGLNSINRQHLFCNLGYWVRQTHQRRGVASRSVRALVPHAFQALGLRRVEIVVAEGNTPSRAVALKAGAQLECVARNRLHIHGVSVPATVFSMVP